MSHAARATREFNEDDYLQRALDVRDERVATAIVNRAIDDVVEDKHHPLKASVEAPLRVVANGPAKHQFREKEDEYVLLLARQYVGQDIDSDRLTELDADLRNQFRRNSGLFAAAIRDGIRTLDQHEAGVTVPQAQRTPVHELFALIVLQRIAPEKRDDLLMTDVGDYMNSLRNAVRLAALEFGIDKPKGGPRR